MSKLLDVRLRDRGCLQVSGIRVDASFWHYVTAYVQTSHVQLIDLHGTGSFERRADSGYQRDLVDRHLRSK